MEEIFTVSKLQVNQWPSDAAAAVMSQVSSEGLRITESWGALM